MSDIEHEAGAELDDEAKAFLAKEQGTEPPEPRRERARPERDFDPTERKVGALTDNEPDEEPGDGGQSEVEAVARAQGWVPKEEFQGRNGAKWVDAQEFIDRGNPAKLRERVDLLAQEQERRDREYAERVARIERMAEESSKRQQREFDARLKALQRERDVNVAREAAANGEEAALELAGQWDAHIEGVAKERPQFVPAPQREQVQPQAQPGPDGLPPDVVAQLTAARDSWLTKNPGFRADKKAYQYAAIEMEEIKDDPRFSTLEAQFAELDRRLAPRFPEIYKTQSPANRNGAAPPANARSGAMDGIRVAPKKTTNYASRLNAAERSFGERLVKRGDYPSLEAYAKEVHTND